MELEKYLQNKKIVDISNFDRFKIMQENLKDLKPKEYYKTVDYDFDTCIIYKFKSGYKELVFDLITKEKKETRYHDQNFDECVYSVLY